MPKNFVGPKRPRGRPCKDGSHPRVRPQEEIDAEKAAKKPFQILQNLPQGATTFQQQRTIRAALMPSAMEAVRQIDQYIKTDKITPIHGKGQIKMSAARSRMYELVLRKVVPDLRQTEVEHRTALQEMPTEVLIEKIAKLVGDKPELKRKLFEHLGGKVIDQ